FVRPAQVVEVSIRTRCEAQTKVTQIGGERLSLGSLLIGIHKVDPTVAVVLVKVLSVVGTGIIGSRGTKERPSSYGASLAISASMTINQQGRCSARAVRPALLHRPSKIVS